MSAVATTVLKLALRLAERGDHEGAAEALRGVLAMTDASETATAPELRAVTKKTLARALDCTTRHIDNLEKRGRLAGAVLGEGAGKRYLIAAVFAALGKPAPAVDTFADEVRADIRRRATIKLVSSGGR